MGNDPNNKKTILGWYQAPGQPGSGPQPEAPAQAPALPLPPAAHAQQPQQPYQQQQPYQPQQPFQPQQPYQQQPYQPQQPYQQQQPYQPQQPFGTPPAGQPQAWQGPPAQGYPQAQGYGAAAPAPVVHAPGLAAPEHADERGRDLRENANATAGQSDRLRFIRLTYAHLMGAILVFAGLLYLLMTNEFLIRKVSAPLAVFALDGRFHWAIVLAVFMGVSWLADYWATHTTSRAMQYAGLGIYVIAEALIFVPLLVIVMIKTEAIIAKGGGNPNILRDSAFATLAIFGALTASVFLTKKDFSFLRSGLMMASGAALLLIALSLVFGFNLGIAFSIGMVLLAAGYILFQTSQVLAHYDPRNYVAASLALFSSVALMFWYVIRIFMRMRE